MKERLCLFGRNFFGRNFFGRKFFERNFFGRNFFYRNFFYRKFFEIKVAFFIEIYIFKTPKKIFFASLRSANSEYYCRAIQ